LETELDYVEKLDKIAAKTNNYLEQSVEPGRLERLKEQIGEGHMSELTAIAKGNKDDRLVNELIGLHLQAGKEKITQTNTY